MADVFLTEGEIRQLKTVLAEKESLRKQLANAISKLNELTRQFNLHTHATYEMSDYGRSIASESSEPSSDYYVSDVLED